MNVALYHMKSIREAKGLSLSDVANGSGYSRSYISKIENGHRLPTFRALCHIYATLGYELVPMEIKDE